jgi:SNF2 family DNA or RNA helicase
LPGREKGLKSPSSKLSVLWENLETVLAEGHKALVFSQWTSFLDLIGESLSAKGIRYSRLDGSTTDRARVVREFQEGEDSSVMLLSLKAGGVGLNLTRADHVFLMDPWWNPAVEEQALGRVHRIGQTRPVMLWRLVATGTIEERILELQARKRRLAEVSVESEQSEEGSWEGSLGREDLMGLFDPL